MLEKVDIHITDHCNLSCKCCTHFSPLAEETFLSLEEYEKDLSRLSYLTKGNIRRMFLIGGEPLLHPQLNDFFPIARRLFPNTEIIIITNGILLPTMKDDFWEACKLSNIKIWDSDYNIKKNKDELKEKARQYGVYIGFLEKRNQEDGQKTWDKYVVLDLEGKQYYIDSFEHCAIKDCVALQHGRLYTCCCVAHIEHFNKFFNQNLEVTEFDYIDIYKVNNEKAILDSLIKPIPFCRYCKPLAHQNCYWDRSEKVITEWT